MTAVEDASVAAETADVVDLVFSYLFIFLIIKWGGAKAEGRGGAGGVGGVQTNFHRNRWSEKNDT